MRVMITGEQGQLARAIAARIPDKYVEVGEKYTSLVSRVHEWKELDVTDIDRLDDAVEAAKPDVIVHSAAIVNTDKCDADPHAAASVNLMGTRNVIEVCRDRGIKLLYFSTTATYDPAGPRPFREAFSPQRAPTMYGITKLAGEMLVTGSGVPHMVVRPCFVYGDPPRDHSSQLVKVAVHEALRLQWPEMASFAPKRITLDPSKRKDYMRVEDFADAVVRILELNSWRGDVFNVSNQTDRPMGDYFEALRLAMSVKELHVEWDPEADYMGDHLVSSEKLRACTGWSPRISVGEGVAILARSAGEYVARCRASGERPLYR